MRVEDHPYRMGPGTGPDGEPGVVGDGRSGADDDGVGECAQAVEMTAVLRAGDIVGVAGAGRDEPVEALAELGEGEARSGEAERQIAVGEFLGAGGGVPVPVRASGGVPAEPGGLGLGLGADRTEHFPGGFGVQGGAASGGSGRSGGGRVAGHRDSSRVSRASVAPKESASAASSSFPLPAEDREGRPMTPVPV